MSYMTKPKPKPQPMIRTGFTSVLCCSLSLSLNIEPEKFELVFGLKLLINEQLWKLELELELFKEKLGVYIRKHVWLLQGQRLHKWRKRIPMAWSTVTLILVEVELIPLHQLRRRWKPKQARRIVHPIFIRRNLLRRPEQQQSRLLSLRPNRNQSQRLLQRGGPRNKDVCFLIVFIYRWTSNYLLQYIGVFQLSVSCQLPWVLVYRFLEKVGAQLWQWRSDMTWRLWLNDICQCL